METAATRAGPAGPAAGAPGDDYSCARVWAALTSAHARITGQLGTALDDACGLSINDFEILLRLEQAAPAGLRQGGLDPAVRLTQPSLSRAVARLERRGWLRRARSAADRRGVIVSVAQQDGTCSAGPLPCTRRPSASSCLTRSARKSRICWPAPSPGWLAGS